MPRPLKWPSSYRIREADERGQYDDEDPRCNRFSVRYRAPDDPPEYITLIKDRLDACGRLHGDVCVPKPTYTQSAVKAPLWVIDTDQQCIVAGSSVARYLALSYTWAETGHDSSNATEQSLLLDSSNPSDFRTPGFLAGEQILLQIPHVIRHAIRLVTWLGERYLGSIVFASFRTDLPF
jgi:hypothetical protein